MSSGGGPKPSSADLQEGAGRVSCTELSVAAWRQDKGEGFKTARGEVESGCREGILHCEGGERLGRVTGGLWASPPGPTGLRAARCAGSGAAARRSIGSFPTQTVLRFHPWLLGFRGRTLHRAGAAIPRQRAVREKQLKPPHGRGRENAHGHGAASTEPPAPQRPRLTSSGSASPGKRRRPPRQRRR